MIPGNQGSPGNEGGPDNLVHLRRRLLTGIGEAEGPVATLKGHLTRLLGTGIDVTSRGGLDLPD